MSETEKATTIDEMQTTTNAGTVEDPIIEVRNTTVSFGMERGESRVLDNVTLDIERREILGVVGESGSGKSMFASALLDAIVRPGRLSGEIIYHPENEEAINVLDLDEEGLRTFRWEEIAMVFQGAQSSFNPTITLRDHFIETIEDHEYNLEEQMAHAKELLSDLHLSAERVLDSYPHELSGGMKQRALIALSLVLEPEVLVMDEPTAALDLLMQRSILTLLEDLKEKYDITVVFITHDLPLVAGLSDRLGVLYAFEFVEVGPAHKVVKSPSHPYTRALLKAVPDLEIPLQEMRPIEGSAPDPVNVPSGCSYHPRCPLATEECRNQDPGFYAVSSGHQAACHHWTESEEAIPLELDSESEITQSAIEGHQGDEPILSLNEAEVHFDHYSGGIFDRILNEPEIVHAVDGVDLDIYDNDVVAVVGESGCGKTTLGKTAIGVQRPTGGSVMYQNQDVWDSRDSGGDVDVPFQEIRKALQMIHQDPGSSLNPNRKIQASLEEPLKHWSSEMDPDDREARVLSMLEYVGMSPPDDYAQRFPHQLSGGEQQRIALIRALLMNPDLILADEAVSALDVSLRVEMMDLMLELQEWFDTSFLFISHDLANARYFAANAGGRIGVMYLGEIIEIGPAEQVIHDPRHPYTKVLHWASAELEVNEEVGEPPIRGIDIPDPIDPPSGCRFHTRCPEARKICTEESPALFEDNEHCTACFREVDDHEYWNSEPIDESS